MSITVGSRTDTLACLILPSLAVCMHMLVYTTSLWIHINPSRWVLLDAAGLPVTRRETTGSAVSHGQALLTTVRPAIADKIMRCGQGRY
jgi:hypothetical protein